MSNGRFLKSDESFLEKISIGANQEREDRIISWISFLS